MMSIAQFAEYLRILGIVKQAAPQPFDYLGTWNASTNTPTLVSSVGVENSFYIVNVAGSTNLNGTSSWAVGDWALFSNGAWEKIPYSSISGALLIVNNLSDLNNTATAQNNLQIANGIQPAIFASDNITLVNSGGNNTTTFDIKGRMYIDNQKSGFSPIDVVLPAMNSTTPGARSILPGQSIYVENIANGYDVGPHAISMKLNGGAGLVILQGGEAALLTLWDNSTPAGQWYAEKIANASTRNTSDVDPLAYYYVPVLTNSAKTVNNFPAFDTTRGSLKDSGYNATNLPYSPTMPGFVSLGDGDYAITVTSTRMAAYYVMTPTVPGRVILLPAMNLPLSPNAGQAVDYYFLNNGDYPQVIAYNSNTINLQTVYPGQQIAIRPISNANANGGWVVAQAGPIERIANTLNDTPFVLYSFPLGEDEQASFTGLVNCKKSAIADKGQCVTFQVDVMRPAGGDIFIDGDPIINANYGFPPEISFAVDVPTQSLQLIITGAPAISYDWKLWNGKIYNPRYYG